MTTGDALLAAIKANPDDNTPRLIYADWIEGEGFPVRAELIRLSCKLYGVGDGRRLRKERKRVREIFHLSYQNNEGGLFPEFFWERRYKNFGKFTAFWDRGFVTLIAIPFISWQSDYETYRRIFPLLKGISVSYPYITTETTLEPLRKRWPDLEIDMHVEWNDSPLIE